ncbi:MAG TPA: protein kinase [Polyangia bacterium]|nr:protein kinase [Polyangia bacterium]
MDASPPEAPDPRIGSVLQGRYRILSRIASGAMGVVYRGERVQLGRPVAVKFLHPWIASQQAFITRFDTEARAMSRLGHPNCVSVIDFGVEGAPYLVMDFVTGRTLREAMGGARFPVARALHVVRQLLAGLAHAHAQGIIHRDLKPENLLLSEEAGLVDHLRILDFGLAKLRDGPAMTAGLAVGTPSYMSPEQTGAEGAIDARTDLYAVGVLLFELLTGRKPFQSENVGELLLMHRERPAPLLRSAAPDAGFSAALEGVVDKALAKMADQRFQSAAAFGEALDATPEGRGGAVPKPAVLAPAVKAPASVPAADATIVESPSTIERIVRGDPAPVAKADRRRVWLGVGLGAAAVAALLIGRGLRGGEGTPATTTTTVAHATTTSTSAGAPKATAPVKDDERLAEARRSLARGDWEQALDQLARLRAESPDDAEAAYLMATIDLEHKRWSDGLAAAQIAVRKDPALKSDADLIRDAIASLASDAAYERAQALLHGMGAAATPFLKEAARHDANPKVRERAAELLEGGGRSSWSWSGGRASSGGSVFHR